MFYWILLAYLYKFAPKGIEIVLIDICELDCGIGKEFKQCIASCFIGESETPESISGV